jgi:hypothetical protein
VTEVIETRWAELIDRVEGGGPDAAAAARTLLEGFINGSRNRRLGGYIARCLGEYLRDGVPIEMALHLSGILPPVVKGPAGEGDRRSSDRATGGGGTGTHPDHRHLVHAQQGGRGTKRRQPATDTGAQEKRGGARPERRRKAGAPPRPDGD